MTTADFDRLSLSDLQVLPYSTAGFETNLLPQGAVFGVRTRHVNTDITFAKVQIVNWVSIEGTEYDLSMYIRWTTYTRPINYLSMKITCGSTPDWLLTKYLVECTYTTPNGVKNCGSGTFGPEGGTVQGQVSDESGAFPSSIVVTVTLDFQPDTNLAALIKTFTPPVTDTGVNFIFEPYQVIQKTDVLLDLRPRPATTDYLLLRWQHHNMDGQTIASGQKYISGNELREQPVTQYEIVFVADPVKPRDLKIQIEGRFQDKVLTPFNQTYELADKAVLIRDKKLPSGYILLSV
jgi:hypothetical protein